MRKIIESTLVSLDGAFRDPHIWATEYFDAEAEAYAVELLSAADAMLMGRQTYGAENLDSSAPDGSRRAAST